MTERIREAPDGSDANSSSFVPRLNADGRFVYFTSFVSNLVAGDDEDNAVDAYLFDRATGTTTAIASRPQSPQVGHSSAAGISGDGRYLTFTPQDDGFVTPDTNGHFENAWLLDRTTGRRELVGVNDDGPATATGVTLVDRLPDAVFVSATASQGACAREGKGRCGGLLTCELGSLAAGSSATVTIVVTPSRDGTITTVVAVRANEPDDDRADNTATEQTTVLPR